MKPYIIIILALFTLSACHQTGVREPNVKVETTIEGLSSEHWTYFCFEKGEVVGTSEYGNEEQDALWADRLDWDFAICGKYLRTNSGTSGKGRGGVVQNKTNAFATLSEAPSEGYLVDELF